MLPLLLYLFFAQQVQDESAWHVAHEREQSRMATRVVIVVVVVVPQLFLKYVAHIFATFALLLRRDTYELFFLSQSLLQRETTTVRRRAERRKADAELRFIFIWFLLPFVFCAKALSFPSLSLLDSLPSAHRSSSFLCVYVLCSFFFIFSLILFAGLLYINVCARPKLAAVLP